MDSIQVMSARFNQDDFWDPNLYTLSHTGSIDYPGTYAEAPLEAPLEAPYPVCSSPVPLLVRVKFTHLLERTRFHTPVPALVFVIQFPLGLQFRSLILNFQFETTLPQRNSSSRSIRSDQPGTWASAKQIWPSIDHVASPDMEPPKRAKVPLPPDPRPPTQRKARKPPSGEVRDILVYY